MTSTAVSERKILLLLWAIQFINILDFMMVMPLGPDFARGLGIPSSMLGLIGGSYTASAAVGGIVAARFLDRFDRRKAMAFALAGLVVGTALGGLATGLHSLMAARVMAGAFGGPATSLCMAIVADVIPLERRGRAMGIVMSAFAVASVVGVPAGLSLASAGGWQMPFFGVAALGAVFATTSVFMMPPLTAHITARALHPSKPGPFLSRPVVALSLASTFAAMMGNFALIPNLSAFFQFNRGYPRAHLDVLYLVAGVLTFVTMRIAGALVDRVGSAAVVLLGTALYLTTLFVGFIYPLPSLPVMVLFVGFMVTGTFRMVPMQALSSRVPAPHERARFMSSQSAVQHVASAAGAMLGARVLSSLPDGKLVGVDKVAWFAAGMASLLPFLLFIVERIVRRREAQAAEGIPAATRATAGDVVADPAA